VKRYELAAKYASGRVLDAACGCGYGTSILSRNAVAVGIDYSPSAIDWAETYYPGPEYIRGKIEDEPWSGKFEAVISLETLEHLPKPSIALQAFRRAGKVLIASVPNEELYPFRKENFSQDDSPHFRHYTPVQFQELLEGSGSKVSEKFCQKDKKGDIHGGTDGMFLIYVCE